MSARSLKDAIVALHIDKPVGDGFELRSLKTSEFSGTAGDGLLSLAGFTGIEDAKSGLIHLFVVNNRPSVDSETGKHHDQWVSGANSTIDVFTTTASATELKFVRTYADKHIATPNRVAAVNSSSFYITNDHGKHKHGLVSKNRCTRKAAC